MENWMKSTIHAQLAETRAIYEAMEKSEKIVASIEAGALACLKALQAGNKILLAGNGGSAADAQHVAGEYVSRFAFDRPGLPSIALTTDTSILTAIGNQALNVGNLTAPMDSLPTFIYFNSGQPDDLLVAQAWGASLVLLLFVLIVNIAVRGRSVGRRAV